MYRLLRQSKPLLYPALLVTSSFMLQNNVSTCDSERKTSKVFGWGANGMGQIGVGDFKDKSAPSQIKTLGSQKVVQIAAGGNCSAMLTNEGKILTVGAGDNGRLGNGNGIDTPNQSTPQMVNGVNHIKKVAIGVYHMTAIDKDGVVWSWGKLNAPQLGQETKEAGKPSIVDGFEGVRDVDCGRQQTIIVDKAGQVFSCGNGYEGALGHGNRSDVYKPKLIEALKGETVVQVSCGREFTLVLTEEGKVWSFGANDYGNLGTGGSSRFERLPVPVTGLSEHQVVKVCAGEFHSAVLTQDGKVFTFGQNKDGQLGNGSTQDSFLPTLVQSLEDLDVVDISCGGGHTACITKDGQLFIFGRGRSGQLGRGNDLASVANSSIPNLVNVERSNKEKVKQVACGYDHTIALSSS